ncbi:MAG: UDP-N-acetylmuramoyl-L-alanyl-D-glutamate--2,6-diaminopimelate ligase [Mycobacteriaceae bacterium]|nr:UDP-N-acetylmuramoyl-L-alanyl-D-glutamate--2,6-diaminopimelate ligase [Mycobacteriaceae bacterium]
MQSGRTALRPEQVSATPLAALAESVSARIDTQSDNGPVAVTGVEQRSAHVLPGDLFVGLPGAKAHGARFAADAVSRGAAAVLTDSAGAGLLDPELGVPVLVHDDPRGVLGEVSASVYGRPSERLLVVGITGTSGKTTTSYLIEAGLTAGGRRTALIGTIGTRVEGRAVPSALTTPEAPQLHAMFAAMVEQGIDAVVMEVSSHALALGRVDGVRFDVAAFTNLSQDHFDFHAGFEDYFAAKARLFAPESRVRADVAVVCVDDEWGQRMVEVAGPFTVTVSTSGPANWTLAEGPAVDSRGQRFTVDGPMRLPMRLRLPGPYNVANALLAVATCVAAGVDAAVAADALAQVQVPGRMERVDRGQDFLAVVDYAHKPAAVEAVLAALRSQNEGRIAAVVGAGGDRDSGKRPLMGEVAARAADLVVITDDNPRTEDPAAIREQVAAGARAVVAGRGEIRVIGDRAAAIAAAVAWAGPGDVVLVAGKGHETGQEIHGVKHPFDDRTVLAAALDQRVGGADAAVTTRAAGEMTQS